MRAVLCHIIVVMAIVMSPVCSAADDGDKYPFRGEVLQGYDEESVRARCDAVDLQPIEGVWYYPDEGMTVVVERIPSDGYSMQYRLVLVDSDDMMLLPGTVIGYCKATADANKFRLWLYGEQCDSILENPQVCLASLDEHAQLLSVERSEVKMRVRVNFSRFLPKLLKGISVTASSSEVDVPEGFRKIYPCRTDKGEIIYL